MGGHYTRGARRIARHAIGQNPTSVRAHRPALRTHRGGDVAPTRSKPGRCRSHTRATRRPGATAPRPDESSDPDDSRLGGARNNRCLARPVNPSEPARQHPHALGDTETKIPAGTDADRTLRVLETTAGENPRDGAGDG